MRKPTIFAALLLASFAGRGILSSYGQDSSQQTSTTKSQTGNQATKDQPAGPTKDKSKAATPNSTPSADALPSAPDPSTDSVPSAPKPSTNSVPNAASTGKKPSTADANPFPEDISRQAQQQANEPSAPDAPAPQTPPSTPAPSSSAPAGAKPAPGNSDYGDLNPPVEQAEPPRKELKLESPDGTADIYDPKRASEDVRVGKFYLQTGDYRGAYERLKDATAFDHENVEAVFYLAEAARKMNLPQEAIQDYQLYLTAGPVGQNAKAAKKALSELAPSKKQ